MVKVEAEEYSIQFDEDAARVTFRGSMRLQGPREYEEMKGLLRRALALALPALELDFTALKFLNSSGLGTIGQFIIDARRAGTTHIVLHGSAANSWQNRSLGTLRRIWADVDLHLDPLGTPETRAPAPAAPPTPPPAAAEPTRADLTEADPSVAEPSDAPPTPSSRPPARADSIFGHLAMYQTRFEDHPFFVRLREHPPSDWVAGFLPFVAFWVKAFQDLLGIVEDRVSDPEMRAIASHIRRGDRGHDEWFVRDMTLVGNLVPTYQEVFGPAHKNTRLASYTLVSEALQAKDERHLIVLLLSLEAASYVFFTKLAEYLEHADFQFELQYFGRRHLDAELEHGIVDAKMDDQVELGFESKPELRTEALNLIERVFAAFDSMFTGFVLRPAA